MITSRQLAQLIGPTICVMTLAEIINLPIWKNNIPGLTFINGVLLFVAGLSIIRVHNFWVRDWSFLITIVGWLTLILGSLRMLFPTAEQAGESLSTYLLLFGLLIVGFFLSFKGYYPTKDAKD